MFLFLNFIKAIFKSNLVIVASKYLVGKFFATIIIMKMYFILEEFTVIKYYLNFRLYYCYYYLAIINIFNTFLIISIIARNIIVIIVIPNYY